MLGAVLLTSLVGSTLGSRAKNQPAQPLHVHLQIVRVPPNAVCVKSPKPRC